jgi:serine/threonine protein kinase
MNKPIAEGSFADVFLTNGEIIKRINVKKIAKKKELSVYLIKDYIESEISLLRELNHKNIISYIRSKERNEVYDVHLEYCKYGDTFQILKSEKLFKEYRNKFKGLTEKFLESMIIQTCQGLDYLHNMNLIHRDIKPHNILLTENLVFKIADFGFTCCDLGNVNLTQFEQHNLTIIERKYFTKSGTPYYIAPEIYAENYNYTCISDLWSLGVSIYEMYFNKLPFPKLKSLSDLSLHLQKDTSELFIHDQIITENIPITLKRILTGLLTINPECRLKISDIFLILKCEPIKEVKEVEKVIPQIKNDNEIKKQEENWEKVESDEMYCTFVDENFSKSFVKWLKENEN